MRGFFRNDESGVVAVEFAIVSLPFFAIIFATIAIGLYYFYAACLDYAVYRSARLFMTGQVQANPVPVSTPAQFSNLFLCPNMPGFMQCTPTNPTVSIAIITDPTFGQAYNANIVGSHVSVNLKQIPTNMCSPGQGDIVYLQAIYKMPTFPLIYTTFGGQLISGTTVKVEEFPSGSFAAITC